MSLNFTTFDVFTTTPFRGNPLAIVQVPAGTQLTQDQKQLIAREFNLSETVFLHEQTTADIQARTARIDIFTPYAELPFAGHPTVGTANYLLHHQRPGSARILMTKAGPVPFQEVEPDPELNNMTGAAAGASLAVAHNVHVHDRPFAGTSYAQHPVVSIVNGMTAILAQVPNIAALSAPTANLVGTENTYTAKASLDAGWRNGPVMSYFWVDLGFGPSSSSSGTDGVRKLRARHLGFREDPATGSAASGLCSFLALLERDDGGPLVRRYEVTQGVEMGRQSTIRVQVTLDSSRTGIEEVLLSGNAVKVLEGKVPIPAAEMALR
ncbi:Diaminopimelate epimerase-like protein [Hypoxylon sp. NC1633]|nr:Diaminopimelate epimerase-like protein [Hypoxylon sp. NC1633]